MSCSLVSTMMEIAGQRQPPGRGVRILSAPNYLGDPALHILCSASLNLVLLPKSGLLSVSSNILAVAVPRNKCEIIRVQCAVIMFRERRFVATYAGCNNGNWLESVRLARIERLSMTNRMYFLLRGVKRSQTGDHKE